MAFEKNITFKQNSMVASLICRQSLPVNALHEVTFSSSAESGRQIGNVMGLFGSCRKIISLYPAKSNNIVPHVSLNVC